VVRVIEEYPSTAAELAGMLEPSDLPKEIGLVWLRRLLRRGRKYRMKVFAVAQEFEVNTWKIAGEDGLQRAFTVLPLHELAGEVAHRGVDADEGGLGEVLPPQVFEKGLGHRDESFVRPVIAVELVVEGEEALQVAALRVQGGL
jgi:hypothetical protein